MVNIEKIEENPPKKPLKKKVTWAPEEKLHKYHTYTTEIEIEVKNSRNAYEIEKNNEKRVLQERKDQLKYKLSHMIPTTQWITPQFNGFDIERGYESEEIHIQDKRCLQVEPKYFLSHQIPDSPLSPPPEIIGDEQSDILQTLTENPHLLSQLLGMIQQPQQPQQTQQTQIPYQTIPYSSQPLYETNPYSTNLYTSPNPYSSIIQSPPPPLSTSFINISLPNQNVDQKQKLKCRFYNTNVGCRNGNNCPFYHG